MTEQRLAAFHISNQGFFNTLLTEVFEQGEHGQEASLPVISLLQVNPSI